MSNIKMDLEISLEKKFRLTRQLQASLQIPMYLHNNFSIKIAFPANYV